MAPGIAGGGTLLGRRAPGHDRAPRLGLLDDDLAALHELEHREERDRDDDPVMDALEQVLEHDDVRPRSAWRISCGAVGEQDRAADRLRRRGGGGATRASAVERGNEQDLGSGGAAGGRAPASAGRPSRRRLAVEQADPRAGPPRAARARVAERAVEDQPRPQLRLGVRALVRERDRALDGPPRQQRPAT